MAALVGGGAGGETPISELAGLGESTLEALSQAGISTVEQLGGMTPEQLEEIPGIGPKTVEKIFVLVNRFFGANIEEPTAEEVAGASADVVVPGGYTPEGEPLLTETAETELERTGQDFEAELQRGVLEAPLADEEEIPVRDGTEPAPDSAEAHSADASLEDAGGKDNEE
jgi:N utilization substance protein A